MERITYNKVVKYIKDNNLPFQIQGYYENYTLWELENGEGKRTVYECVNENPRTILNYLKGYNNKK